MSDPRPGPTPRIGRSAPIPVGAQPARPGGEAQPVVNLFDAVGGQPFFDELVERFYRGVAADPLLAQLYPDDLTGPKRHLALFLGQYWGGPTTYSDQRGHPRLRMRHQPFRVNPEARDHWLDHMRHAVASANLAPLHAVTLMDYLERAAYSMVNTFEETPDE